MASVAPEPELDLLTVERARKGDRAAQTAFVRRYVRPLHAFVCRSGAPGEPDDLTQDLLAKLLGVLPRFDPRGPARLTTWVFTVAHRWLLDERKRRHLSLVDLDEGQQIADLQPGAEHLLARKQLAGALEAAIGRLPDAQRRVFVLVQVHGQPLEAVAEVEGVPVGTIKSRLHRARAQLALWLGPALDRPGVKHGSG